MAVISRPTSITAIDGNQGEGRADGNEQEAVGRPEGRSRCSRLQIRAACAVIRMGWSEAERISRAQFSEYRWQAPHCPADLREMLNGSG
jgi:hypothetical protein